MADQVTVKVLQTGIGGTGAQTEVKASLDTTVEELKSLIASQSGVPADEQRLIYAGQVLKDQRTLRDHGYKGGNVIHLVRSKKSSSQSASPSAAPQLQQREPAVGMPSAFGMPPGGGLAAMQQELQRNPDAFNAMFENPMMDRLLENPETVRAMMMANPEVRRLIEANPEMERVLMDPATIRQSIAAARNPRLRAEMMRIQDRQLANVEMMPGGFDQLRRLHQTVDAAVAPTDREQPSATPERPVVAAPTDDAADAANPFIALLRPPDGAAPGPSSRPAPNPWAARPPPEAPAVNPFASLFGGGGGNGSGSMVPPTMPPFGGAMGGVPGPEQLAQVDGLIAALEANPGLRQAMEAMMGSPEMVEMHIQSNPAIRNNPQAQAMIREAMRNPEMRRQIMDPQMMRRALELQRSMGAMGGMPGLMPFAPQPPTVPAGTVNAGANPWGGVFQAPVEQNYDAELAQMRSMGFHDEAANLAALRATGGNVSAAVDRVLSQMGGSF